MWLNPLSMPMAMVTVEDEGGHLWTTAVVEGRDMWTTAHVEGGHLWATPMETVDDEGHHILEACFGNPIEGKQTFGATNHPNIERADYNNERFEGAESKGATSKSYGSRMFAEFREKKMETNTC